MRLTAGMEPTSCKEPGRGLPVAMSIATSDCGAGAGVQADLLTFAALNVFGITSLAALTAQNPLGVEAIHELPPEFLLSQLNSSRDFFHIDAIKTGMLFSAPLIEVVANFLEHHPAPVVVDPVMASSSGACLLQDRAIQVLTSALFPRADLITPNLDETELLLGTRPASVDAMRSAAGRLCERFECAVLVKGGHLAGNEVTDILVEPSGNVRLWQDPRVEGVDTHGGGCTLAAAIAAYLARGYSIEEAVDAARHYLLATFKDPLCISNRSYINHFPRR